MTSVDYDIGASLGLGDYVGEIREAPDGELYEWVETVDGLGNPIGFWKAIKAVGGAVGKAAGTVFDTVGKAAGTAFDTAGKAAGVVGKAAGAVGKAVGHVVGKVVSFLDPVRRLFQIVVETNKASARRMRIPRRYIQAARAYAQANPRDGRGRKSS